MNVSSSGLFIESPDPVPPPTVLNLRFVLDDEAVDLGGEVVRSVGGRTHQPTASGMGVRFQDPEAVGIGRLLRYGSPL